MSHIQTPYRRTFLYRWFGLSAISKGYRKLLYSDDVFKLPVVDNPLNLHGLFGEDKAKERVKLSEQELESKV